MAEPVQFSGGNPVWEFNPGDTLEILGIVNHKYKPPKPTEPQNPQIVAKKKLKYLNSMIDGKRSFNGYIPPEDYKNPFLEIFCGRDPNGPACTTGLYHAATWESNRLHYLLNDSPNFEGYEKNIRIDMLDGILRIMSKGFWVRDMVRAGGGLKTLIDVVSYPVRKPSELGWDATGIQTLYKEIADVAQVNRDKAITRFIGILKKKKKINPHVLKNALWVLPMKMPVGEACTEHGSTIGSGFFPTSDAFKCIDEIIRETFTVELIKKILLTPENKPQELGETLMEIAAWLEENDNWVAAQVIYEQLADNKEVLSKKLAETAKYKVMAIAGNPEERSPFTEKILPPMPWNYEHLSAAEKYAYPEQISSFGLSMWGGIRVFKGIFPVLGATGNLLARNLPLLKKFTKVLKAAFKRAGPKAAIAETAAAGTANTIAKPGVIGAFIARPLGWVGGKSYVLWDKTFAALGRFIKNRLAPVSVALGRPFIEAVKGAAANPKSLWFPPAWIVTKTFEGTGWVIKTLFRPVKLGWKPVVFSWWTIAAVGDPFIKGIQQAENDPGPPILKEELCKQEIDWTIDYINDEDKFVAADPKKREFYMKLKKELWKKNATFW